MKKIRVISLVILLFVMGFLLISCQNDPEYHTVIFDSDGGSAVESVEVEDGKKATEPTAPVKEGYTFLGWYLDDNKWDFNEQTVTKDITLTAKWDKNTTPCDFLVDISSHCLDDGVPYKLEYTSNGDGTCSVSNLIVNINYTNDFELVIPEKSPENETVTSINWGVPFSSPIVPLYLTPETFADIIDWLKENGYDETTSKYLIFNSYFNYYDLTKIDDQNLIDDLKSQWPIFEYYDKMHVFTGEMARELKVMKIILDEYSSSIFVDEYNKILTDICNKTELTEEQANKIYSRLRPSEKMNFSTYITDISLPSTIIAINNDAFCFSSPVNVHITDLEKWCSIEFGTPDSNPLSNAENLYINEEIVTHLVIPDGITAIKANAFFGLKNATSLTIPDSVVSIGACAFDNWFSLENVYITDIAKWCNIDFAKTSCPLKYAENLYLNGSLVTELEIPEGVTKIPALAFSCNSIISVKIPNSVTKIEGFAFYLCINLETVTIGNNVSSIGDMAFYSCSSLTTINYVGTEEQWNAISKDEFWDDQSGDYTLNYNYIAE